MKNITSLRGQHFALYEVLHISGYKQYLFGSRISKQKIKTVQSVNYVVWSVKGIH